MATPIMTRALPSFRAIAHPWLCDIMGHLTTRHYVAMFDDAGYHLLHAVFGWSGGSASDRTGFADVRQEIDYVAEVGSGDLLEITSALVRLGRKSFTSRLEMTNLTRSEVASRLVTTSVCFDLTARRAIEIPNAYRARAEAYLAE